MWSSGYDESLWFFSAPIRPRFDSAHRQFIFFFPFEVYRYLWALWAVVASEFNVDHGGRSFIYSCYGLVGSSCSAAART